MYINLQANRRRRQHCRRTDKTAKGERKKRRKHEQIEGEEGLIAHRELSCVLKLTCVLLSKCREDIHTSKRVFVCARAISATISRA